MKQVRSGSCLLMVMMLITLISLFCIHAWRITITAFETTLQKQKFEQNFCLTDAFMQWGLDFCKNNFDKLYDYTVLHPEGFSVEAKKVTIHSLVYDLVLRGKNKKKPEKQCIALESMLHSNHEEMSMSCSITRKYDAKKNYTYYKVSKWSLNQTY